MVLDLLVQIQLLRDPDLGLVLVYLQRFPDKQLVLSRIIIMNLMHFHLQEERETNNVLLDSQFFSHSLKITNNNYKFNQLFNQFKQLLRYNKINYIQILILIILHNKSLHKIFPLDLHNSIQYKDNKYFRFNKIRILIWISAIYYNLRLVDFPQKKKKKFESNILIIYFISSFIFFKLINLQF